MRLISRTPFVIKSDVVCVITFYRLISLCRLRAGTYQKSSNNSHQSQIEFNNVSMRFHVRMTYNIDYNTLYGQHIINGQNSGVRVAATLFYNEYCNERFVETWSRPKTIALCTAPRFQRVLNAFSKRSEWPFQSAVCVQFVTYRWDHAKVFIQILLLFKVSIEKINVLS